MVKELPQVLLEAKDEMARNRTLKVFTTSAPICSSRLVFTEELEKMIDRLHGVLSNNEPTRVFKDSGLFSFVGMTGRILSDYYSKLYSLDNSDITDPLLLKDKNELKIAIDELTPLVENELDVSFSSRIPQINFDEKLSSLAAFYDYLTRTVVLAPACYVEAYTSLLHELIHAGYSIKFKLELEKYLGEILVFIQAYGGYASLLREEIRRNGIILNEDAFRDEVYRRMCGRYNVDFETLRVFYSFLRRTDFREGYVDYSRIPDHLLRKLGLDRNRILEGIDILKKLFSKSVNTFIEGIIHHHSLEIAKKIKKTGITMNEYFLLYQGIGGYDGEYDPHSLGYCLVRSLLKGRGKAWLDEAERKNPWELPEISKYLAS